MGSCMSPPDLAGPVHRRTRQLLYASGNFGKSLVWAAFDTVLFFYLTSIAGIPLALAGAIIMTALVWDGFGDLVIGYWADRTGRKDFLRTLLVVGAPICGTAFAAVFHVAAAAPGWRIVAVALLCWICRIGYTLCDVAHNAMLVTMSANERDASIVSGLRLMFSAAGAAAVGLALKAGLAPPTVAGQQAVFVVCAIMGGIAYTATLWAATGVKDASLGSERHAGTLRLRTALAALAATASYRRLCLIIFLQAGVTSLFMKSLPFFGASFFGEAAWAGDAIIVMTIAQVAALPVLMMLGRRGVSTRTLTQGSHALTALSLIGLPISAMYVPLLAPVALVGIGVGLSGMNMTVWANLALIVRNMTVVQANLHALPVGLFLAILKCAAGIGSGILAFGLSWGQAYGMQQGPIILIVAIAAPFASSIACIALTRRG